MIERASIERAHGPMRKKMRITSSLKGLTVFGHQFNALGTTVDLPPDQAT
jgi:hypothetical protein